MPNKYDAYREALVMETRTIWLEECGDVSPEERARLEKALHADPQPCVELDYVRTHTGFCRQISVTSEDRKRLRS